MRSVLIGQINAQAPAWSSRSWLGIFTSTSGSAPNRIFNIEWRTAYYNSGGSGVHFNYEVRL